jgi:hypothetical protein
VGKPATIEQYEEAAKVGFAAIIREAEDWRPLGAWVHEHVRTARLAALREARAEIGYAHAEADEAGHRDTHGLGAAAALIDALIAQEEAKT